MFSLLYRWWFPTSVEENLTELWKNTLKEMKHSYPPIFLSKSAWFYFRGWLTTSPWNSSFWDGVKTRLGSFILNISIIFCILYWLCVAISVEAYFFFRGENMSGTTTELDMFSTYCKPYILTHKYLLTGGRNCGIKDTRVLTGAKEWDTGGRQTTFSNINIFWSLIHEMHFFLSSGLYSLN